MFIYKWNPINFEPDDNRNVNNKNDNPLTLNEFKNLRIVDTDLDLAYRLWRSYVNNGNLSFIKYGVLCFILFVYTYTLGCYSFIYIYIYIYIPCKICTLSDVVPCSVGI